VGGSERACGAQQRNYVGDSIDILRKAAQQALETLKDPWAAWPQGIADTIIALEAALAQPQRKPLTEDEIELAYREIWRDLSDGFSHTSVEWIEAGIRYAEKVHGIE